MLAMCSGALRQYLLDHDALPDRSLVAAVPMSLRGPDGGLDVGSVVGSIGGLDGSAAGDREGGAGGPAGDAEPGTKPGRVGSSAGGNALGVILCPLATHQADAAARLAAIRAAMQRGKSIYAGMTRLQITAMSGLAIAPLALFLLPGMTRLARPPFNVLISNVPGPNKPLFWNGARMEGLYPLSIPYDGLALNITVTSYFENLEFGLTGCRRSVPSLQRILTHLETSLTELERATGIGG
jgi:diacylglycerol O-acyltransferase